MILATPHLAALDDWPDAAPSTLLDDLSDWNPAAIGVERLALSDIVAMEGDPDFAPVLDSFVGSLTDHAASAQSRLGLNALEAADLIRNWSGDPQGLDRSERTRRTLLAMAAYEPETALLYATPSPTDLGLPDSIAAYLDDLAVTPNERVTIAVALARRLGLSRISNIDSQADKDFLSRVMPSLESGIRDAGSAADIASTEPYLTANAVTESAIERGDFRELYQYYNSEEFGRADVRGQFDLLNRLEFSDNAGRVRQAAWDHRNFRIAANIRRVSAEHPGENILVIIGAGHKPFLDELLAVSLDVRVAQATDELFAK